MVAEGARERRSKLRMQEQRAEAIDKRWHPEKYESVNVSDPKRDTRAEVAREAKIPERPDDSGDSVFNLVGIFVSPAAR